MSHQPRAASEPLSFASAISIAPDPDRCAGELCDAIAVDMGSNADLAVVFASGGLAEHLPGIASAVQRRTGARRVLGCSAEGVAGGNTEVELESAASVLVGRMPGVELTTFDLDALAPMHDPGVESRVAIGAAIGARPDTRAALLLVDPFSVPMGRLLPVLDGAMAVAGSDGFAFGGLASAGQRAGENRLLLDSSVRHEGLIGLTLSGALDVDVIVSQGCRPIGPTSVVTRAKGNLIFELGGRRALDVAKSSLEQLNDDDRKLLAGGLFLGQAATEYKPRLGRGDFLVRPVMGAEPTSGAIAVGEIVRTGQTVQFHLRDSTTAREDLELLLDGQVLHGRPAGVLMITCNGRGKQLFGESGVDVATVQRAFAPLEGGAAAAKLGAVYGPPARPLVPLAGFFASGEIGPLGGSSFVHGHTACAALFRGRSEERAALRGR